MFKLTLTKEVLSQYVSQQLNTFFPDQRLAAKELLFNRALDEALDRTEYCFKHISLQAYHSGGTTYFSHLHSDQYTLFLWFLSNSVWGKYEDSEVASKLFYLNKLLNGFICMYDAKMPNIFLVLHGGGIVLGKASYGDFFVCCQGSTIGAVNGSYPTLGNGVALAPQSTIVGGCQVSDHVTIGTQALLRNKNLSTGTLYYRDSDTGQHETYQKEFPWAQSFFNVPIPLSGGEVV